MLFEKNVYTIIEILQNGWLISYKLERNKASVKMSTRKVTENTDVEKGLEQVWRLPLNRW